MHGDPHIPSEKCREPGGKEGTKPVRTSIAVLIIAILSSVLGCAQAPEPIYVTATPHPRVATETAEAKAENERQVQASIRATVAAIVPTPEPASSIQTKVAEALATLQPTPDTLPTTAPEDRSSLFGTQTPPQEPEATPHPGTVINIIQPPGAPTQTPAPTPAPTPTPYNTDEEYKITEYERVRRIDLSEGDCIVFEEGRGEFDATPRKVPCNGEWTHRALGFFEVEAKGSYPGENYFLEQTHHNCGPNDTFSLMPRQEGWELGDRQVTCLQNSFGMSVTNPGKLDRLVNRSSVREGSCINHAPETGGLQFELVDCSGTWEMRLLNRFAVSDSEEYPGENEIARRAFDHCDRRMTNWVYPDQGAWSAGLRTVECLQENLTGERGISSILDRLVNPFLLNLNECFNPYENPDLFLPELTACSGEWEFQVIRTVRIPGNEAYPGEEQVEDKSFEICGAEAEYILNPEEIDWESGYRNAICLRTGPGYIETPTPPPAGNGGWTYFEYDCPPEYDNCVSTKPDDLNFISLRAYQDGGTPPSERAEIRIGCSEESPQFSLDGWGRRIGAKDAVLNVRFAGQRREEGTSYLPEGWLDDLEIVWLSRGDSTEMIRFIESAEVQRRDVTIEISGGPTNVVAHFDVTGFITNFQRLPCSN